MTTTFRHPKPFFLLVLLWSALGARSEDYCEICKEKVKGKAYFVTNSYHKKTWLVCEACTQLATHCEVCGLVAHPKFGLLLPDGRVYCPEDAQTAVLTDEGAVSLFAKGRQEAMDLLARYPPVPHLNIAPHLVTREEFIRQYRKSPGIDDPEKLLGLTLSRLDKEGKFTHDIYLLHGIPEGEFLCVCAHEYTHAWLVERQKKSRQMHKDTVEGFCELMAYKVAGKLGFEQEKIRILASSYTRGQITALVAADEEYGLHRLVQWVSNGVDSWVDSEKLPRLLVLREMGAETLPDFTWWPVRPSPVPDKLVLRGLSGTAGHRFALINDATFGVGEEARVRVGASNQVVRCLSIKSNSVLIQVRGEPIPRKLELSLK